MGLLFGLVGVSFVRSLDGVAIRRAANETVNLLRYTRGQAVLKREEQTMDVDLELKTLTGPQNRSIELHEKVDITLRTAMDEIQGENKGSIRFFGDGSSTGGRITLTAGEREWRVNVNWLTGEIELEEDHES